MTINHEIYMTSNQALQTVFNMFSLQHLSWIGANVTKPMYNSIICYYFKLKGNLLKKFISNHPILLTLFQDTKMGGGTSTKTQSQRKNSLLEDWETIDHLRDFNIVRHKSNGVIGEVRKFKLNPAFDPQRQISIHKMREQANVPIVKSYGSQLLKKVSRKKQKNQNSDGMCASNNHLGVITQRIPFTLKNLPQLSFLESLYVLRQTLTGYEFLFPKTGPVHVNENKIGVNDSGQVKVWINEDWSQNHPNDEITSLSSTRNQKLDREYNLIAPQFRDQKQMVQNVVDVIEDKCQYGHFPNQFSILLRQNSHSFVKSKNFVIGFIQDRNLYIPSTIHQKTIRLTKKGMEDFNIHQRQIQQNLQSQHQKQIQYQQQQRNNFSDNMHKQKNSLYTPIIHFDVDTKRNVSLFNANSQNYKSDHPVQINTFSNQNTGPSFHAKNFNHQYKPAYDVKTFSSESHKPKVNFGGKSY